MDLLQHILTHCSLMCNFRPGLHDTGILSTFTGRNKKTVADRFLFTGAWSVFVPYKSVVMIRMTALKIKFIVLKECDLVPPYMPDAEQLLQIAPSEVPTLLPKSNSSIFKLFSASYSRGKQHIYIHNQNT